MRSAMAISCSGPLPLTQDHLGEAVAQRAVVVEPGEAQVLEGHAAQPRERGFDRALAALDRG